MNTVSSTWPARIGHPAAPTWPIVRAAASDRRRPQPQEYGWRLAQPDTGGSSGASSALLAGATASTRMADAIGEGTLSKTRAFIHRDGARRAKR